MQGQTEQAITVIGAGPAGLFACDRLLEKGFRVSLYDRMPSPGRKLLAAGSRGGLNITNSASLADFAARYGSNEKRFAGFLEVFSPADLHDWLAGLGIGTDAGSGGKLFPEGADTPELLRRWMSRLSGFPGFTFYPSYRFAGIADDLSPVFETGGETVTVGSFAVVLALGGASWPRTGSDGGWIEILRGRGIGIDDFRSANCGYEAFWDPHQTAKFTHVPLKNITLTVADGTVRGEIMLTPYGMEGGPVYALGPQIRSGIDRDGSCTVFLDLLPDWTAEKVHTRWSPDGGTDSLVNRLRKKLGLGTAAAALLRGCASAEELRDSALVASLLKHLPVKLLRSRPLAEAISSAGGVRFDELDGSLMLALLPGWFCAGEMLDWEAPTGGFLLQGCFSTAATAAAGAGAYARVHDAFRSN